MANVNNAFAALIGAESQLSSSKKKKNKAKQTVDQSATLQSVSAPVALNGHAAPAHTSVDVSEATAILERAAREARTIVDKSRLWKEWTKQVRMQN